MYKRQVRPSGRGFLVETDQGAWSADAVVVASERGEQAAPPSDEDEWWNF